MVAQHWVRVGVLGTVGRFAAAESHRYARGTRVICRTSRGLETGEVLAPLHADDLRPLDGSVLRRITIEDDLLIARLQKNRDDAYLACQRQLASRGIPAVLVDVEHLFDGLSLVFYFLGETTPEIDSITADLAETYEATVQFRKFTETLTLGCGPGCGTENAENGCASGACSTCAALSACSTRRRTD
jgi:cell fate regulator YaaT (PSP1 superfamily)